MCRFSLALANTGKIRTAPTIQIAGRLCVPVPALAEFRFGILKSGFREKMTAWLDDSLATTKVLAVDETTTRHYAEIRLQPASPQTRPFR